MAATVAHPQITELQATAWASFYPQPEEPLASGLSCLSRCWLHARLLIVKRESARLTLLDPVLMVAPTPVKLSPTDTMMSPVWFTVLYVIPPPEDPNHAFGDLSRLHDAFCALIDHDFPLFLGKMQIDEHTGAVSILPSLNGGSARADIEFVKARSETLTTEQVVEDRSVDLMPSHGLPIMTLDPERLCAAPLMAVRCTLLSDGGLVIGMDTTHALMDAQGMATFMMAWGEHYRGVARTPICHNRQLMAATGVGAKVADREYYVPRPKPLGSVRLPCSQKVIRFSRAALNRLKTLASSGCSAETVPFISTLDALSAYFTLLITQSRTVAKPETRIGTVVNARKRLQPPLPRTYAGNAFAFGLTKYSTADELSGPISAETLSIVAHRLRACINACDDAYVRDTIEFVADLSRNRANLIHLFDSDVSFTSWLNVGICDANFGARPWYVAPGHPPLVDGFVIFREGTRGADAVDAMLGLEAQAMERLEQLLDETNSALGLE